MGFSRPAPACGRTLAGGRPAAGQSQEIQPVTGAYRGSKFQPNRTSQAQVIDFVVYWCAIVIFCVIKCGLFSNVAMFVHSKFQPNRTSQARVIDFVVYWCAIEIFWGDKIWVVFLCRGDCFLQISARSDFTGRSYRLCGILVRHRNIFVP